MSEPREGARGLNSTPGHCPQTPWCLDSTELVSAAPPGRPRPGPGPSPGERPSGQTGPPPWPLDRPHLWERRLPPQGSWASSSSPSWPLCEAVPGLSPASLALPGATGCPWDKTAAQGSSGPRGRHAQDGALFCDARDRGTSPALPAQRGKVHQGGSRAQRETPSAGRAGALQRGPPWGRPQGPVTCTRSHVLRLQRRECLAQGLDGP